MASDESREEEEEASEAPEGRWASPVARALLLGVGLAGAGLAAAFIGGGQIGGGDDPPPRPVSGAPKQVVVTVTEFQRALARGDYATICGNLFTLEAREAAGGDRCPSVLQETAGALRRPDVRIVSIKVRGKSAEALVQASVDGGAPVTDTIRLAEQDGRYRIVSAGREAEER